MLELKYSTDLAELNVYPISLFIEIDKLKGIVGTKDLVVKLLIPEEAVIVSQSCLQSFFRDHPDTIKIIGNKTLVIPSGLILDCLQKSSRALNIDVILLNEESSKILPELEFSLVESSKDISAIAK